MDSSGNVLKAVVFDMDGVIVDSEAQWKALEREFFRSAVPGWNEEHHAQIVGMGVEDLYHHLTRAHGMKMDKTDYLNRSNDVARQVYMERVACADGFTEFLAGLRRRGVKTAVASSSPRRWIDMVLRRFALEPSFDAIACADDVGPGRTKPQPDIYLMAAEYLGLAPSACLAVEDSAIGLKAAKAAGLYAAALRTAANQEQDLSQADFELAGFIGLDFDGFAPRLRR